MDIVYKGVHSLNRIGLSSAKNWVSRKKWVLVDKPTHKVYKIIAWANVCPGQRFFDVSVPGRYTGEGQNKRRARKPKRQAS
jgi:hypothetical protein